MRALHMGFLGLISALVFPHLLLPSREPQGCARVPGHPAEGILQPQAHLTVSHANSPRHMVVPMAGVNGCSR